MSSTQFGCILVIFVVILSARSEAQRKPVDDGYVRLRGAAFSQLPAPVKAQVASDGCLVPQFDDGDYRSTHAAPTNVIAGEFAVKGQRDWAVLCSTGGTTGLKVYWGASRRCPDPEPLREPDIEFRRIGYVGWPVHVTVESLTAIRRVLASGDIDASRLPTPAHDGIRTDFDEKATAVMYCNAGQWVTMYGGD